MMRNIFLMCLSSFFATAFAQAQDSPTKLQDFSVWLIPANEDLGYFENVIENFAHELGTPVFIPHVTVYFGQTDSLDKIAKIVESYAKGTNPIKLRAAGVGVTEKKYKSLFVVFDGDENLVRISSEIGRAVSKNDYQLHPHLSLLYRDMPISEKKILQKNFRLEVNEVTFDRIELIREDGPDDVSKWVPILIQKLAGQ